jgi:hypothetical protein
VVVPDRNQLLRERDSKNPVNTVAEAKIATTTGKLAVQKEPRYSLKNRL